MRRVGDGQLTAYTVLHQPGVEVVGDELTAVVGVQDADTFPVHGLAGSDELFDEVERLVLRRHAAKPVVAAVVVHQQEEVPGTAFRRRAERATHVCVDAVHDPWGALACGAGHRCARLLAHDAGLAVRGSGRS